MTETRTIRIRCSFELDVQVAADLDERQVRFSLEENSCPGTGLAWKALREALEESEETGFCWACNRNGKNEVLHDPEQGV